MIEGLYLHGLTLITHRMKIFVEIHLIDLGPEIISVAVKIISASATTHHPELNFEILTVNPTLRPEIIHRVQRDRVTIARVQAVVGTHMLAVLHA